MIEDAWCDEQTVPKLSEVSVGADALRGVKSEKCELKMKSEWYSQRSDKQTCLD